MRLLSEVNRTQARFNGAQIEIRAFNEDVVSKLAVQPEPVQRPIWPTMSVFVKTPTTSP